MGTSCGWQVSTQAAGTKFASRCRQPGIVDVTLHGYRYAWAERALKCD
jgi:hypothetical protein